MDKIKRKTILIVDDEEEIRFFLDKLLSANGFITVEAENGVIALKILDRIQADLIILDVIMPKMNGIELYKKLKADHREQNIPLLFCTATPIDGKEDITADICIRKPFNITELLAKIRKII
jgi:DNA-binding response OmpR family regulator